ncbi:MAG: cupin domain-containing protein [Planctomycetota bacterium]
MVQVVEGEGEFVVGGERCRAGRGEVVLMPADVSHSVEPSGRFKMLLTMLRS